MRQLQPVAVRYLNLELVKRKLVDAQPLPAAAVVVELNVALLLLCLLNILYRVLRVWDNLVDKGSYHVVVFVHDIVFYRIAAILLISFCYVLFLVDDLSDDAAALRIAELLLRPLNLVDTEREGRPGDKFLVRLDNVVLANFYYIGIHRRLFQMKIGIGGFWNFVVGMTKNDNPLRILSGTDNHLLVVDHGHCIYIVRKVRILDSVYR